MGLSKLFHGTSCTRCQRSLRPAFEQLYVSRYVTDNQYKPRIVWKRLNISCKMTDETTWIWATTCLKICHWHARYVTDTQDMSLKIWKRLNIWCRVQNDSWTHLDSRFSGVDLICESNQTAGKRGGCWPDVTNWSCFANIFDCLWLFNF